MQLSNKVVNGLVLVLAVIVIAFGLGCDGKSSDDDDGGGSSTSYNFRVKILDRGNEPVSGVYVVLHQANGLVESYKTTGSDGIANFGDIGRTRATISIAHVEYEDNYSISSWVNIPFLTGEDNTFFVYPDEEEIATINVTTTGEGYDYVYLQPFGEYGEPAETISVDVYNRDIQDDGKLSMAAVGFTEGGDFTKYGYLLDQDLVDGNTYPITLGETPTEIEFSSTNGDILYLYVGMQRKGIDFQIGGYGSDIPFSSGLIEVGDQLPDDYDYCMIEAETWSYDEIDFENGKGQVKKYSSLPDPIEVTMPDFSIDAVDFDDADSTITWTESGSQDIDMTRIYMGFYSGDPDYKYVGWIVMVNPTLYTDEWNLFNLQLPDVIDAWFEGCNIDDVGVELFDSDTATGFEDFITSRLENPDEDWASWFDEEMYSAWGYKDLEDGFPVNKTIELEMRGSFREMRGTHLFKK